MKINKAKMERKMKTLQKLRAEVKELERAYKTINAKNSKPAEMIGAIELLIRAFKSSRRHLALELRRRARELAQMTDVDEAREARKVADCYRDNVTDLSVKIRAMSAVLLLYRRHAAKP